LEMLMYPWGKYFLRNPAMNCHKTAFLRHCEWEYAALKTGLP